MPHLSTSEVVFHEEVHIKCKYFLLVSEMTYTVSSGTLNSTIPYRKYFYLYPYLSVFKKLLLYDWQLVLGLVFLNVTVSILYLLRYLPCNWIVIVLFSIFDRCRHI